MREMHHDSTSSIPVAQGDGGDPDHHHLVMVQHRNLSRFKPQHTKPYRIDLSCHTPIELAAYDV